MRPIPDPPHQPVLDRVDVDVVDMTSEVALVSKGVLPIAPLPDAAFSFGHTAMDIRSPAGSWREKPVLIRRQRVAKSASPGGIVQIAWR